MKGVCSLSGSRRDERTGRDTILLFAFFSPQDALSFEAKPRPLPLFYQLRTYLRTPRIARIARIHLLTPLGIGNNIHSQIRTKSIFICICALN